jgi:hypothetical protein
LLKEANGRRKMDIEVWLGVKKILQETKEFVEKQMESATDEQPSAKRQKKC